MASLIFTIIIFLIVFSVLVIAHELGHFLLARLFHVKVLEFGLGYPPRAYKVFTSKSGTDFTINWLPLGGFVSLAGEAAPEQNLAQIDGQTLSPDEKLSQLREIAQTQVHANDKSSDQPLYLKPVWQRLIIIAAGPTFSLLTGMILFAIVFCSIGIPQLYAEPRISEVVINSPAQRAGIQPHTAIISLSDNNGQVLDHPQTEQAIAFISAHSGQEINITTQGPCDANEISCANQPTQNFYNLRVRLPDETPAEQGSLGLTFQMGFNKFYPAWEMPFRAIARGFQESIYLIKEIIWAFSSLIAGLFNNQTSSNLSISGPVGIINAVNQQGIFKSGIWSIISFAGMLSINLGIINFLPIPAVDGGQMILTILEKFMPVDRARKIQSQITALGFAFLIFLTIFITFKDITTILTQ